ncbi:hypothetical protein KEM54_004850, partial [Ascosphaera aggregata]
DDVFLPWKHIATLMGDGLTPGAIKQHMEKLRRLVGRQWAVPAPPKRGGNRRPRPGSKEEKDKEHARLVDEVTAHDYRTMWEVAVEEGRNYEELPKTVENWRRFEHVENDGMQAMNQIAPENDMPPDSKWIPPPFPPPGREQYPAARLAVANRTAVVQQNGYAEQGTSARHCEFAEQT